MKLMIALWAREYQSCIRCTFVEGHEEEDAFIAHIRAESLMPDAELLNGVEDNGISYEYYGYLEENVHDHTIISISLDGNADYIGRVISTCLTLQPYQLKVEKLTYEDSLRLKEAKEKQKAEECREPASPAERT